jgi:hypothetical protein
MANWVKYKLHSHHEPNGDEFFTEILMKNSVSYFVKNEQRKS